MATSTLYATAAELKARLSITDAVDDAIVTAVIEAASRQIDDYTNRRFYTTSSDETRYFTAEAADIVFVGDFTSITSLATDDGTRAYATSWAATDYDPEPFNAALDGRPYTQLLASPQGLNSFPAGVAKGVRIVGRFGYTTAAGAIPDAVNEACLGLSAKLFKLKDAPFGVLGGETGLDPIRPAGMENWIRVLLNPYRFLTIGAVVLGAG